MSRRLFLLFAFTLLMPTAVGALEMPSDRLVFYWAVGCPRCDEAKPFVAELERKYPDLEIERVDVRGDDSGRARFFSEVKKLGLQGAGVPLFVVGNHAVVGFRAGVSERRIEALFGPQGAAGSPSISGPVDLPLLGEVDPSNMSLPVFTVTIGFLDGLNPCAMYVLLVMLGILLHVRSRLRLLLFGGTFILMSGLVYFMFMVAWTLLFQVAGFSETLTRVLGVALVVMAVFNLKDLVWFRAGVSLSIPDEAKPGLFRRIRAVADRTRLSAALVGIAALAFVVNLVELGCTIGLPAVYTRILALRADLGGVERYAYLALYNLAYILPLATILVVYALTLHRLTLNEAGARILKGLSGVLLLIFGILFIFAPRILSG